MTFTRFAMFYVFLILPGPQWSRGIKHVRFWRPRLLKRCCFDERFAAFGPLDEKSPTVLKLVGLCNNWAPGAFSYFMTFLRVKAIRPARFWDDCSSTECQAQDVLAHLKGILLAHTGASWSRRFFPCSPCLMESEWDELGAQRMEAGCVWVWEMDLAADGRQYVWSEWHRGLIRREPGHRAWLGPDGAFQPAQRTHVRPISSSLELPPTRHSCSDHRKGERLWKRTADYKFKCNPVHIIEWRGWHLDHFMCFFPQFYASGDQNLWVIKVLLPSPRIFHEYMNVISITWNAVNGFGWNLLLIFWDTRMNWSTVGKDPELDLDLDPDLDPLF